LIIGVAAKLGRRIRIFVGCVICGRMFEDYRLLVAFAFPFGFDTVLADLSEDFSAFFLQACLRVYSQDAPLHI
jgi:hypothetical protein